MFPSNRQVTYVLLTSPPLKPLLFSPLLSDNSSICFLNNDFRSTCMSYVRRQRLSWARIKLSCFWYLYFVLSNLYKSFLLQVSLTSFLDLLFLAFPFLFLLIWQYFVLPLRSFSLKDLLFTFQCTFSSSFFFRTIFIILYHFFFVNTFLKIFFINFGQNKKLVMTLLLYSLSYFFITNFFNIFICFLVLFYNIIFCRIMSILFLYFFIIIESFDFI